MTHVPYICLLYAFALIYVPRMGPVSAGMKALPGGYDNSDPRTQAAALAGRAKRALNAHNNGFEAFAPFAVALLVALRSPHQDLVAGIAIGFCVARTIYVAAYVNDKPSLRSGVWSLGLAATIALFVVAILV